jgi:hypothetical protein
MDHLSGAGEAEFFGNGDEAAQITQIHPGFIIAAVSFCPAEFEFADSTSWLAQVPCRSDGRSSTLRIITSLS